MEEKSLSEQIEEAISTVWKPLFEKDEFTQTGQVPNTEENLQYLGHIYVRSPELAVLQDYPAFAKMLGQALARLDLSKIDSISVNEGITMIWVMVFIPSESETAWGYRYPIREISFKLDGTIVTQLDDYE